MSAPKLTRAELEDVVARLTDAWTDQAEHYTCDEADAMFHLIRTLGPPDYADGWARGFLESHIASDSAEENDRLHDAEPALELELEDRADAPTKQYRIVSNYGTFAVTRIVDAVDEDEAWTRTGIMSDLVAAGWTFDESPDGEDHEITEVNAAD